MGYGEDGAEQARQRLWSGRKSRIQIASTPVEDTCLQRRNREVAEEIRRANGQRISIPGGGADRTMH